MKPKSISITAKRVFGSAHSTKRIDHHWNAWALMFMVVLGLVAATPSAQGQTFSNLYIFQGGTDGAKPYDELVRDSAGNLYGTTRDGGAFGYGTVFKVDTSGTETVLYSFCSVTGCMDGLQPWAGLVRDKAGNLYGTTTNGGLYNAGTVFKVTAAGKETVLYTFTGGADGKSPFGGLVRDSKGNLYGTTYNGGDVNCNCGVVFKVAGKKETVLHTFTGVASDGAYPYLTGLLMDTKGNLYGVAASGGTSGEGVLYVRRSSGTFAVLYSFAGGVADGCHPHGTPAIDRNGNLYGTTQECGPSNAGVVWKISKRGKETVLHNFAGRPTEGSSPYAGAIIDANGNLYGTTQGGGNFDQGTVYKLTAKRVLKLLHSFGSGGNDGQSPFGGVIRDGKGNLYGTTTFGGASNSVGTVWQITK